MLAPPNNLPPQSGALTPQHPHTPNAHPNAEEPETANADGDNAGDDTGEAEAEAASDEMEAKPEAPGGAGETNNTENNRRSDGTARDEDDDAEEKKEEEQEEERDFGDDFKPGRYDHAPILLEIDGSMDSLPSFKELANDPFAIVDHLPLPLCYGAAGGSFKEIESIPKDCQFSWSTCFGQVCEALTDAVNFNPSEHGHPPSFQLKIERRIIKMFFLIPTLML